MKHVTANGSAPADAAGRDMAVLDEMLARKLDRRTRRIALAPWLYHLGLVEFSRHAHKSKGRDVTRVFDAMRARDLAMAAAAYLLVPSELLGAIGLVTDALAMQQLAGNVPAEEIAIDRCIGAFPIAAAWALEFNTRRARIPVAALVPGIFHATFAVRNRLAPSTAAMVIAREVISDGVVTYILAEFSGYLRSEIRRQFIAVETARRSYQIAAERRSRARLWLVGTHARLNALAASRWAAENVKSQPGAAKFIEAVAAEEIRLREMFESSEISLTRVVDRIAILREARELPTAFRMDDLQGQVLKDEAEATIEWLIEAVCPFVSGRLEIQIEIRGETAIITLQADNLPTELMRPFESYGRHGRQCIQAVLPVQPGA